MLQMLKKNGKCKIPRKSDCLWTGNQNLYSGFKINITNIF